MTFNSIMSSLVKELAQSVDVLIENFKPGTMEKWGLGPGKGGFDWAVCRAIAEAFSWKTICMPPIQA